MTGQDRTGQDRTGQDRTGQRILFLGKRNHESCLKAADFVRNHFSEATVYLGKEGDSIPEDIRWWNGDYIISYLSEWTLPEYITRKAEVAAIRFHPASPDYPGVGPGSFALYENAREYGVTCHYLAAPSNTGEIIAVRRFPVLPNDDAASLLTRTDDFLLTLFHEITGALLLGKPLPTTTEQWSRKPFTQNELNELRTISAGMPREEIEKRIRATSRPGSQPMVEISGHIFELKRGHKAQTTQTSKVQTGPWFADSVNRDRGEDQ